MGGTTTQRHDRPSGGHEGPGPHAPRSITTPRPHRWRPRQVLTLALGGLATLAVAIVLQHLAGDATAAAPLLLLLNQVDRRRGFQNDTRRAVFDTVKRQPGVCIAAVADEVGVSHSTASYHLEKLTSFNLVVPSQDGNKVRYFANGGAFTEDERRTLGILENATTREVLAYIAREAPTYRAEISDALGVSPPTVNWHLDRLLAVDLVLEAESGRSRLLRLRESRLASIIGSLVEKLEPTEYDLAPLQDLRPLVRR